MSLYWVKYEGFPWWPTQVVEPDADTPEGFVKVQYFGTGDGGFVQLDDSATVQPFGDNDADKRVSEDPAVMAAISEADAAAAQIVAAEEERRRRKEEKAARRAEKEEAALREKERRAEEKAKKSKAKREGGHRVSPPRFAEDMVEAPVVKRQATDDELEQGRKLLETVLSMPFASDSTAVRAVRPMADIQPTVEQLYTSGIGRALSAFVTRHDWPHAAALAAGVLEFWFFKLQGDIAAAVRDF
jgi:hypothetical protein